MTGILDGVRVLDLTSVIMGPLATQALGDLGADVIKVEAPEGDISRQSLPRRSPGMGRTYLSSNRNKRSIVINLKDCDGRSTLLKLARKSDVLVYNIRPAAMARLNLSYEDLATVNERIIYVGAFGFSQRGPYAAKPAYDDVIQGLAGLPSLFARASGGEPRYVPMSFADRVVSSSVTTAVLGALYHRERTGRGQRVDVPMFETLSALVMAEHLAGEGFVPPLSPIGHARSISKERRPFKTQDGYICTLIYTDQQWRSFLRLIDKEHLLSTDERFTSHSARTKHGDEVMSFLAGCLAERTTCEWLSLFENVDIPAGPVQSLEDILTDDHLRTIGFFKEVEHPTEGRLRMIASPIEWSEQALAPCEPPPGLGQHTVEILREAGCDAAAIAELLDRKIVTSPFERTPSVTEGL